MSTAEDYDGTDLGQLAEVEVEDEAPVLSLVDATAPWEAAATADEATAQIYQFQDYVKANAPNAVSSFIEESTDPLIDAVNNGIVPPNMFQRFYFWLAYNAGVSYIPAVGTYAFVAGLVVQWAQSMGWATLVGPPAPTPAAQAITQSLEVPPPGTTTAPGGGTAPAPTQVPSPVPLPYTNPNPTPLPSPSPGKQATAGAAKGVMGGTVTGGGAPDVSAAEVTAALNNLATQIVELQADVLDAMFPGMAPGQVPESLTQLNRAASALENQVGILRRQLSATAPASLSGKVSGIQTELGTVQSEITQLQDQMGEKASSGLETDIKAQSDTLSRLGDEVGTIAGVTLPALDAGLGTVTSGLGALDSLVTSDIEPRLTTAEDGLAKAAASLALTDDECLAALCDAEGNVTQPIQQGGATPSLLKQLGSLLTKAAEIGFLATLADGVLTILDAPAAIGAVVKDTETIAAWATSAANVIETDLSWQGQL